MKSAQNRLLFFFFLLTQCALSAQNLTIKGGLVLSEFTPKIFQPNIISNQFNRDGIHVGVKTDIAIDNRFYVETGLTYTTKGYSEDMRNNDEYWSLISKKAVSISYLEIPLLAKLYFNDEQMKFHASLGPYFAYAIKGVVQRTNDEWVDSEEDIEWGTNDTADAFHKYDYGLLAGLGVDVGPFEVGATYGLGLHKISTFDDARSGAVKNRAWNIYVGYKIIRKD